MRSLRSTLGGGAAAAVTVAAAMLALGGSSAAGSRATAAGCTPARIAGHATCLQAGRPCQPRYERQYERYGFHCRRNVAGQPRLWQPYHDSPVKPGGKHPPDPDPNPKA